jgi:hypothetical protein
MFVPLGQVINQKIIFMKLKFLGLVTAMVLLLSCGSTRTSTSENYAYGVPDNIHTGFIAQYPNAANIAWARYDAANLPIDWEMTGWTPMQSDDYVVQFNLDDENYYAWYDRNGNWIGSSYTVRNNASLPAAVSNLLSTQFGGYTIEKIDREFSRDRIAYEIKLRNDENKVKLLVAEDGTILKQKLKD